MKRSRKFIPILVLCLGASMSARAQEPALEKPPAPLPEPELAVPAGTTITIALTTFLNSRSSQVGDTLYADVTYPIYIQQRLVIPKGSTIRGTVTHVARPGRIKGKAKIAVRFDDILLPNGVKRDIVAEMRGIHGPGAEKIDRRTETVEMDSSTGRDTAEIGASAGEGAIIGAISDRGRGAGIGAGIGAAAGIATVLFTRGNELILEPGITLDLTLRQPLRFAYPEIEFSQREIESASRSFSHARPRDRDSDFRRSYPTRRRGYPVPWYTP